MSLIIHHVFQVRWKLRNKYNKIISELCKAMARDDDEMRASKCGKNKIKEYILVNKIEVWLNTIDHLCQNMYIHVYANYLYMYVYTWKIAQLHGGCLSSCYLYIWNYSKINCRAWKVMNNLIVWYSKFINDLADNKNLYFNYMVICYTIKYILCNFIYTNNEEKKKKEIKYLVDYLNIQMRLD